MVTAAVGIVVALVSGVFGISAHGLAAGAAAVPPTSGDILMVGAASAGIGAVTAAIARDRPPLLTAAVGLLAGQGLVHLVLSTGHTHGLGTAHIGHHGADTAAVRAAMDSASMNSAAMDSAAMDSAAAGSTGTGHMASLLTPQMLGAHLAAVVLTLTLVAILTGTLAWVAARVAPLLARAHLVVVAPLQSSYNAHAPRARYLLTGGGTRAPPAAV